MAPHITSQTVLIPATPTRAVETGLLIFADDELVAVVMHRQNPVMGALQECWFLQAGFGPCGATKLGVDQLFQTPDEAQAWVLERVSRAREAAAHAAMMAPRVP